MNERERAVIEGEKAATSEGEPPTPSDRADLVGLYHRLEKRIDNEEQGRRAACDTLAARVAEVERAIAGLTATLSTTSAESNRAHVRISGVESLMREAESWLSLCAHRLASETPKVGEPSRADLLAVCAKIGKATREQPLTVAEVSKANKDVPLGQRVDELDVWASGMTDIVAALRRDVDALRRLNTSDTSPAPIEQVGADARNLDATNKGGKYEVEPSDGGFFVAMRSRDDRTMRWFYNVTNEDWATRRAYATRFKVRSHALAVRDALEKRA